MKTLFLFLFLSTFLFSQDKYDYYRFQKFQTYKYDEELEKFKPLNNELNIETSLKIYKDKIVVSFRNSLANYDHNEPFIINYKILGVLYNNENKEKTYLTESQNKVYTEILIPNIVSTIIIAKDCTEVGKCKTFTRLWN